jgi:hypothetical protein
MAKRAYQYQITLEQLQLANGEPANHEPLQLTFENHDDIFNIIERLQQKDPFNSRVQAAEFAIGLKMFSEVMIKNKNHPLFEELFPAFRFFMEKLKK